MCCLLFICYVSIAFIPSHLSQTESTVTKIQDIWKRTQKEKMTCIPSTAFSSRVTQLGMFSLWKNAVSDDNWDCVAKCQFLLSAVSCLGKAISTEPFLARACINYKVFVGSLVINLWRTPNVIKKCNFFSDLLTCVLVSYFSATLLALAPCCFAI